MKLPKGARRVFKGIIFEVWQWQQKQFDGSFATFEKLRRVNTAQVIAESGGKILVIKQRQPHCAKAFMSLPGGQCGWDENPLAAAKRELLEETGYVSKDWQLWLETVPHNKLVWTIYTFIAHECKKIQEPKPDAGEKFEVKLYNFDKLLALADDPNFYEKELTNNFLRAKYEPKVYKALKNKIFKKGGVRHV